MLKYENQRQEHDTGIYIVVIGELPVVIVHHGKDLFGVNRVERHEQRRCDTRQGSTHRKIEFTLRTQKETQNDNPEAHHGLGGSLASQHVGGKSYIKDDSQGSSHIVKGDGHPLETEIVKGDHSNKHDTERENLSSGSNLVLGLRELGKEGRSGYLLRIAIVLSDCLIVGLSKVITDLSSEVTD